MLRRGRTRARRESEPEGQPTRVGEPGDCPECGDPGFLERIRPAVGYQYQLCRSCGTRWIFDLNDHVILDVTADDAVVELDD